LGLSANQVLTNCLPLFAAWIISLANIVQVLESLTADQVQRLTEVVTEVGFSDGESIFHEGDVGDGFYIIMEGQVRWTMDAVTV
jgi:CRP-like cAMP-binding protein